MAVFIFTTLALIASIAAAPQHVYYQISSDPQQTNLLNNFLYGLPGINYNNEASEKQEIRSPSASETAGRLETLDPNSEVELVPGLQQPQQPTQQVPVYPSVPGLQPGQRVFIVQMPVPGYRPGTIGGYQPVYILGAAPSGNVAYPGQQGFGVPVYGAAGDSQSNIQFGVPLFNKPGLSPNYLYQNSIAYQPVQAVEGAISSNQLGTLMNEPLKEMQENPEAKFEKQVSIGNKQSKQQRNSAAPRPSSSK